MSLYNGYFAEGFALDPSGYVTINVTHSMEEYDKRDWSYIVDNLKFTASEPDLEEVDITIWEATWSVEKPNKFSSPDRTNGSFNRAFKGHVKKDFKVHTGIAPGNITTWMQKEKYKSSNPYQRDETYFGLPPNPMPGYYPEILDAVREEKNGIGTRGNVTFSVTYIDIICGEDTTNWKQHSNKFNSVVNLEFTIDNGGYPNRVRSKLQHLNLPWANVGDLEYSGLAEIDSGSITKSWDRTGDKFIIK